MVWLKLRKCECVDSETVKHVLLQCKIYSKLGANGETVLNIHTLLNLDSWVKTKKLVDYTQNRIVQKDCTSVSELDGDKWGAPTSVSNMPDKNAQCFLDVFSACAVTHAMSKDQPELEVEECVTKLNVGSPVPVPRSLFVFHSDLLSEQRADPTLGEYFDQMLSEVDGKSALVILCFRLWFLRSFGRTF